MDNSEISFKLKNYETVETATITIGCKIYEISTHFSVSDSKKYIAELSVDNDYKKAISIIIYDKLMHNDNKCVTLQDVMDADDSAFTEYILSVVTANKELQDIFEQTDGNIIITKRFGIAYKSYINLLEKRMAATLRPITENYNRIWKSANWDNVKKMQDFANKLRSTWVDIMGDMTRTVQQIANVVQPFQQLVASIENNISQITIPTVSKEKIEQWEMSYKKWGEIGWSVLPEAPFNFFDEFPGDTKTANQIAMKFCDTKSMNKLFYNLRKQSINKTDLESAIFCYKNKQYKACSLMLFCIIDSNLIKIQPKSKNRAVGLHAVNKLNAQLDEKRGQEKFLVTALYHINLMACLNTLFAKGNGFINEPATINRNFIDHSMNVRKVRKRDCIQLFLAVHNLLEFLDCIL